MVANKTSARVAGPTVKLVMVSNITSPRTATRHNITVVIALRTILDTVVPCTFPAQPSVMRHSLSVHPAALSVAVCIVVPLERP